MVDRDGLDLHGPNDERGLGGGGDSAFRWKQGRENLLTEAGLRMFQLAAGHDGELYDIARESIDREYESLSPRLQKRGRRSRRHGGSFINYMGLLQEMGLMYVDRASGGEKLRLTDAGRQAELLLHKVPDALRIVPYFLIELLARYRFNNPVDRIKKNRALGTQVAESDVFPYWCLYGTMRALENTITKDELSRFVFRLKHMDDLEKMIETIRSYRADVRAGAPQEHIDRTYGTPLQGAVAQPKYIMGRAGVQTGVIHQSGDTYTLSEAYLPFIDEVLSEQPLVHELTPARWIRHYGAQVDATKALYIGYDPREENEEDRYEESKLNEQDPVLRTVRALLEKDQYAGVILVGPPGTGKSWYARQIALHFAEGQSNRVREVQFHPSYQYEDFVEGHVSAEGGGFRLTNRHLLEMCSRATQSPNAHVMVIDELSRTDPARVIGEALTYMEPSLRNTPFYLPSGRMAEIPDNLIFLATMNPEDRSVEELDAAMERRWAKVLLKPDPGLVAKFLRDNGLTDATVSEVTRFFVWIQEYYPLGHAFFRGLRDADGLRRLWDNQLSFLLRKVHRYDDEIFAEIQARWQSTLSAVTEKASDPQS